VYILRASDARVLRAFCGARFRRARVLLVNKIEIFRKGGLDPQRFWST
jgi:hypothetical protein